MMLTGLFCCEVLDGDDTQPLCANIGINIVAIIVIICSPRYIQL